MKEDKATLHETGKPTDRSVSSASNNLSIADELTKLVKLREQGVLNEEEFTCLKNGMLDQDTR